MFRMRRYRVFVAFAVIAILIIYNSRKINDWDTTQYASIENIKQWGHNLASSEDGSISSSTNSGSVATEEKSAKEAKNKDQESPVLDPELSSTVGVLPNTALLETSKPQKPSKPSKSSNTEDVAEINPSAEVPSDAQATPIVASTRTKHVQKPIVTPSLVDGSSGIEGENYGEFGVGGKSRHEAPPLLPNKPIIHWAQMPEHFPVPAKSLIALPTESPKEIPRIQYSFGKENEVAKAEREEKLQLIRQAFNHSWTGYRTKGWTHDEVNPVSGRSRDPFCYWAATLVDSLDTLWIMGFEEEFLEAVEAVKKIDFTTSPRKDIPVFETTIRYLGGLLSAYDLSDHQHPVLLKKAVELGNVLMANFDTPNRMPILYYYWRPTFAAYPHRASTRAVLAELGSLSMEFTKLAQLTKDPKYYDAVARITNELEEWQNDTRIPGLWPKHVDTSGCRKPQIEETWSSSTVEGQFQNRPNIIDLETSDDETVPRNDNRTSDQQLNTPSSKTAFSDEGPRDSDERPSESSIADGRSLLEKRQVDVTQDADTEGLLAATTKPVEKVDCEPQGLSSPPYTTSEVFTLGGMADSTYEYLPKQHMLLGGLVKQYRTMYEKAADAANENLIYRPMIPDDVDVLMAGDAIFTDSPTAKGKGEIKLIPEHAHLTCFAGGMFGIGAKIFERPDDLDIAVKLTDGCVWAYGATTTGIMPETMKLIACKSRENCEWNETIWRDSLDPYIEQREMQQIQQKLLAPKVSVIKDMPSQSPEGSTEATKPIETGNTQEMTVSTEPEILKVQPKPEKDTPSEESPSTRNRKRQLGDIAVDERLQSPTTTDDQYEPDEDTEINLPTHEQYVDSRIENEKIPRGFAEITDKRYILRPEAIESVFILYRITGDKIWREKGWKMFQAINKHTRTTFGYSAIGDVTSDEPWFMDEMESFWTAETLKYFYLLFSIEDVISLDEYTFNTEAHPFRRPQ